MRMLPFWVLTLGLMASCHARKTLAEQLRLTFSNHLSQLDPRVTLDSVHILWNVPVTEKLGRVIDDTVYVREYNRIKTQLANAQQKNDRDSLAFYRYEMGVMEREIDSITQSIGKGDTTRSYGALIACEYFLRLDSKAVADSTLLYYDSTQTLRYTWFMDSSIARTARQIR